MTIKKSQAQKEINELIGIIQKKKNDFHTIDLNQLDSFIRLCELQREIVYNLHRWLELQKEHKKELDIILSKAQDISRLKSHFRGVAPELKHTLTEEQRKKINNMLHQRRINLSI